MFTFDRYGNRRFDEANTTMPTSFSNQALTNPTISTSNNRLTSTGWAYDSAGNTTGDPDGRSFFYDAENKQIEVKNSSNASIGTYFFDGDGKRVKKVVPSTGETTIFVYDAAGKQIAEYSTVVASANDAKVAYLTADHLGSPRINTDVNGQVTARHDYHPFGEEIDGTGGRTTGLNYGSDTVRKQFTGYERDGETELDFAQARMYENRLGRFTTFDPGPFTPADPQNWNRYAFTLNNPLKFVDPSGKEIELSGQEAQAFVDYLEKKTGLKLKYKVKNGVIRITGSSRDKNFTGTVNEKLRDVVKSAASAAEVAKYEVGKNLINANGNDVFVDDNGDSWNGPRTKDGQLRTSMVDMADINQLDAGATEFAQGLVGHFLEEGIEMRKPGANYENTGTPGAHEKGLKVEAEIISAAVGSKQDTRFQPEGQDQNSKVFNFVYTTVQYDLTFKSTGVTVVKTVPPSVQRPKKQK